MQYRPNQIQMQAGVGKAQRAHRFTFEQRGQMKLAHPYQTALLAMDIASLARHFPALLSASCFSNASIRFCNPASLPFNWPTLKKVAFAAGASRVLP